jgi:hypothetical protein
LSFSPTVAAGAYLALMTLWIYADLNRGPAESTLLVLALLAQLAVGLAVDRWWALALPIVVVVISIPAGLPPITPSNAEPLPLWFGVGFGALVAIPLVAFGVASRRLVAWRWA